MPYDFSSKSKYFDEIIVLFLLDFRRFYDNCSQPLFTNCQFVALPIELNPHKIVLSRKQSPNTDQTINHAVRQLHLCTSHQFYNHEIQPMFGVFVTLRESSLCWNRTSLLHYVKVMSYH